MRKRRGTEDFLASCVYCALDEIGASYRGWGWLRAAGLPLPDKLLHVR